MTCINLSFLKITYKLLPVMSYGEYIISPINPARAAVAAGPNPHTFTPLLKLKW